MKFVHAADLHLDSPLRGLETYEGAPVEEVRGATRRAFENLVDLCLDEGALLLVIAGDLYDGDWRDYATGLFFVEQVGRLAQAGIEVVWIRGNHDAASKITRHLGLPDHVHELSCHEPETIRFEQLGVAVHGIGYAHREMVENLSLRYPKPCPDLLNVGLLHTALDGREGHAPYAPCTLAELLARGYDYWALGHVHRREVLAEDPWVVFSGNLQGRHVKETGPKGATVVTIDDGRIRTVEHRAVDVVRWAQCEVRLASENTLEEVIDVVAEELSKELERAEGRLLSCRVVLTGASAAFGELHASRDRLLAEIRAEALDLGGIYVERVDCRVRAPVPREVLFERDDALGELFRAWEAATDDVELLEELRAQVFEPLTVVPSELLREEGAQFVEIVEQARELLTARLLSGISGGGES